MKVNVITVIPLLDWILLAAFTIAILHLLYKFSDSPKFKFSEKTTVVFSFITLICYLIVSLRISHWAINFFK